jgi:hypothetical protein
MKYDKFFYIVQFLHFSSNDSAIDKNDPNWQTMEIEKCFWLVNDIYSKYYALSEHLSVDEVIVLFKQYITERHKCSGIKIYKLCNKTGYTYDMEVCLGKNKTWATTHMTARHTIVKCLTKKGRRTWT